MLRPSISEERIGPFHQRQSCFHQVTTGPQVRTEVLEPCFDVDALIANLTQLPPNFLVSASAVGCEIDQVRLLGIQS